MVLRAPGGLGDDFERHGLDSVPAHIGVFQN